MCPFLCKDLFCIRNLLVKFIHRFWPEPCIEPLAEEPAQHHSSWPLPLFCALLLLI